VKNKNPWAIFVELPHFNKNRTKDMSHPIEKPKRQRRKDTTLYEGSNRGHRTIRPPFDRERYEQTVLDAASFRQYLDEFVQQFPELFPADIQQGYTLHEVRFSRRQQMYYRRIDVQGVRYTVQPAFVTPYWVAEAEQVWYPLLLLHYGAPYWLITLGFGHHDDFWYRLFCHPGRFNLVGTTCRPTGLVPKDLAADEKISFWHGRKIYICTTAAKGCVWGMEPSLSEDTHGLATAYGVFQREAELTQADYQTRSVNTDGWPATRLAWRKLYKTAVLILCFLHGYIKIRQRASRLENKQELYELIWDAYRQPGQEEFTKSLENLKHWTEQNIQSKVVKDYVHKLCAQSQEYAQAFEAPQGYRTSNAVDRPMRRLDRFLFINQYFHGHFAKAQLLSRAFALCYNFIPFCPRSQHNKPERGYSRAVHYNAKMYSENWLINLLASASLNGNRGDPQMS
jgi:hypothetical protein